jgi:hypothetical protein
MEVKDDMDIFKCKICQELMYDARTIKCGHTFCHDCLSSSKEKICPNCKESYKLIPKTNEIIKEFLKKRKRDKYANYMNEIQKNSKTDPGKSNIFEPKKESHTNVLYQQVKPAGATLNSNSKINKPKDELAYLTELLNQKESNQRQPDYYDSDSGEESSVAVCLEAKSGPKCQFLKDIRNKEVRKSDLKNNNLIESLKKKELLLMNYEDLATILLERGQSSYGNKDDLIEKIIDYQKRIKKINKHLKLLIKMGNVEDLKNDELELILRERCLKIQGNKSEKISTLINYFRNEIE